MHREWPASVGIMRSPRFKNRRAGSHRSKRRPGVLCSDRFSAYLKYHSGKAQFCWAHLKRNLVGMVEFTKKSALERFCRDALAEHARLFLLWYKFPRWPDRSGSVAADSPHREIRNLATALFEHHGRLFTFLEPEGRGAHQQQRRTSAPRWCAVAQNLFRRAKGELATAHLLTVAETCDLQRLNILAYLSVAIACHRRRQQAASLLPR
jgi:hypothetical protein